MPLSVKRRVYLPSAGNRTFANRLKGHRRNDPIGRGQRELVIATARTGKLRCVSIPSSPKEFMQPVSRYYVSMWLAAESSTVANIVRTLEENNAMASPW